MLATDGLRRIALLPGTEYWPAVLRTAIVSLAFALLVGTFLLLRRATGALGAPLPVPQLVATAAVLVAWAVLVRAILRRAAPRALAWVPLGVLLLFAAACSYPAVRLVDWLVWLPAIALFLLADPLERSGVLRRAESGERGAPAKIGAAREAETITQQVTRYRSLTGQVVVRGLLLAEFVPGERNKTLYVGFCPPFERLPDVEARIAEGASATVKVVQVLHNGVQLEVRLSKSGDMPRCVRVELLAG